MSTDSVHNRQNPQSETDCPSYNSNSGHILHDAVFQKMVFMQQHFCHDFQCTACAHENHQTLSSLYLIPKETCAKVRCLGLACKITAQIGSLEDDKLTELRLSGTIHGMQVKDVKRPLLEILFFLSI